MKPLTSQTIADFAGGRLVAGDGSLVATGISTDSRKIGKGDVFIALQGEKFDAHDFLPQVAQAGALAVLVHRLPQGWEQLGCAIIEVPDTLIGLQSLAREHKRLVHPKTIGITGSNGKTSTKDFTAAIMRREYLVRATLGNLNNHIGVPLTLLQLNEGDTCAVVEMGMNHFGEIKVLADIAEPDVAIITNIGVAHIEFLGSRAGIAQEKGMLAEATPADGCVVLNANDEFTASIVARSKAKVITAGIGAGDVCATITESSALGTHFTLSFAGQHEVSAFLPVPGEHMINNAALAAACAWHYGISPEVIANALSEVQLTKGRVQLKIVKGVSFLDDSYNANPDSMRAGLKTLAGLRIEGRKVAVLGRMGELGEHAEQGHREVGMYAAELGLDAVFTVGDEASLISQAASSLSHTQNFPDQVQCASFLRDWLKPGDAVLLKGSRSAGMEQVLNHYEII
jgi:UDP-N-acetylmuramoyl-tripeptide--D-alanyl-D-alanine ligase